MTLFINALRIENAPDLPGLTFRGFEGTPDFGHMVEIINAVNKTDQNEGTATAEEIEKIEQVVIHEDLIASVHVLYRMVFPDGYGKHRCFYNLAKIEGKWMIVNAVDRGFQVMEAEEK